MMYRRPPIRNKRSYNTDRQPPAANFTESDVIREFEKIPLPNEEEKSRRVTPELNESRGFQSINIFGRNISIDEIILVGLLFLLFYEKIDDEILIILLVYILLF